MTPINSTSTSSVSPSLEDAFKKASEDFEAALKRVTDNNLDPDTDREVHDQLYAALSNKERAWNEREIELISGSAFSRSTRPSLTLMPEPLYDTLSIAKTRRKVIEITTDQVLEFFASPERIFNVSIGENTEFDNHFRAMSDISSQMEKIFGDIKPVFEERRKVFNDCVAKMFIPSEEDSSWQVHQNPVQLDLDPQDRSLGLSLIWNAPQQQVVIAEIDENGSLQKRLYWAKDEGEFLTLEKVRKILNSVPQGICAHSFNKDSRGIGGRTWLTYKLALLSDAKTKSNGDEKKSSE